MVSTSFGRIGVHEQAAARAFANFRVIIRRAEGKAATLDFWATRRATLAAPIERAVELCKPHHTLKITGLTANSGWIVVQIDTQSRRAKDGSEISDEAIDYAQAKKVAAVLEKTIVVCREDVQPLTGSSSTRERKEKGTKKAPGKFRLWLLGIR